MEVRDRLAGALRAALAARDAVAVAALRSALGSLDNAGAVAQPAGGSGSLAVEQAPSGVGATDVPRRVVSDADAQRIVHGEIAELEQAAELCAASGHGERAERLRRQAAVLTAALRG